MASTYLNRSVLSLNKKPSSPNLPPVRIKSSDIFSLLCGLKTVVSTNTWTTHHNPDYFPNPYEFNPSRWLGNVSEQMKNLWMPFSKGPRNCIGQAMALFELRMLTATLVKRYNISVDDTMGGDDMEVTDHFLIIPKGQKCLLKFTPV